MAIFLIKDSDATNPNPDKDRGCYKQGDIVEVFEDTKPCIIPPQPPFWIIKVTGITKTQALKYLQSHYDLTDPDKPIMLRRRLYGIPLSLVPAAVRNALLNNRYFETSWNQVRNYIQNKETQATE